MRIIAGKFKRRNLLTLPGTEITRPTSDRVKENIFNLLQHSILDHTILDLFSGSGALGLEALSRGAKKVFFVEENKGAINCIQKNLDNLAAEKDSYEIVQTQVQNFLAKPNIELQGKISLIFADPPYHSPWYETALNQLTNSNLCKDKCLVMLEMPSELITDSFNLSNRWTLETIKKYGRTKIGIWQFHALPQ
jgi:16S rRNA (guanine(966)-N(2))-methyltransferase RsmD